MSVYSVSSGRVLYCGAAQGYGGPDPAGWIVVQGEDECWEYGHVIREPWIKPGVEVRAGQKIATVNGSTQTNGGTAPHLHVSLMVGQYDPAKKISPMSRLASALEPESVVPQGNTLKPEYNEYWVLSPSSHNRGGAKIDLLLLHTQEGDGNADSLARYLANGANKVSYHYTVSQAPDGGVTVCDIVDTDRASWSVLSANNRSINLCFAGSRASWTREQWMKQSKAIDVAAYLLVQDAIKYRVPIKVIPPPYKSDPPGMSDHAYVTKRLKDGSHTDCGDGFPWDFFASCVSKYIPKAEKKEEKPAPAKPATGKPGVQVSVKFPYPSSDEMLVQIWEQLFGPKAKGWPQLGGKTLVDAVAEILKRGEK